MADETKSMTQLIMGIVLISTMLVVGIYILSTMELAMDADNTAMTIVNETTSRVVNETGAILAGISARNGACGALTQCVNATDGIIIPAANYTFTAATCQIRYSGAATAGVLNNTIWKCTYGYTYSADTNASVAANTSVTALGNGTPWLTIIVVVGFAVIVLGLLTGGFRSTSEQNFEAPSSIETPIY